MGPVLFNSFVGAMDNGIEGTLSKVADDAKMSAVIDTLKEGDPIQRYLAQCKRPSVRPSTWIRAKPNMDVGGVMTGLRATLLRKT